MGPGPCSQRGLPKTSQLKRGQHQNPLCQVKPRPKQILLADEPTTHWIGPETLVRLQVEGTEVNALADSGSQVNMVMPSYVHQHEFPVLPLHNLVDHPVNLVGLGGMRTCSLGFVIL